MSFHPGIQIREFIHCSDCAPSGRDDGLVRFGKEFAKRLLRQGAKVCVSDINGDIGSETLQELQRTYGASNVTFKT